MDSSSAIQTGARPLDEFVQNHGPRFLLVVIGEIHLDRMGEIKQLAPRVLRDILLVDIGEVVLPQRQKGPLILEENLPVDDGVFETEIALDGDRLAVLERELVERPEGSNFADSEVHRIELLAKRVNRVHSHPFQPLTPLGPRELALDLSIESMGEHEHSSVRGFQSQVLEQTSDSIGADRIGDLVGGIIGVLVEEGLHFCAHS
ncbi:hypothetical protein PENTCL1PPCAC_19369 [Pristionchus entomophagus]|uniref:Uncharacterized protein n=1 Tax=Pristionchus entomophagus TaxID=358040 RepID=A0AAV5TT76_9BILA|nr:hypothetical protein PENTCL1PPCAC_19369 [Pristionchus entomophagus]